MNSGMLASCGIALGLSLYSASARADCATPPSVCYCRAAAAVVDGHVEAVLTDGVSVRVDTVTPSATVSSKAPHEAGSLIEISKNDYWATLAAGDRIVAAYAANGAVMRPVFVVTANAEVSCDWGNTLDAAEAAQLMVLDKSACQDSVDQRFGKYECNDSSSSCAIRSPGASGALHAIALLGAGLLFLRLRRNPKSNSNSDDPLKPGQCVQ